MYSLKNIFIKPSFSLKSVNLYYGDIEMFLINHILYYILISLHLEWNNICIKNWFINNYPFITTNI